MSTFIGLIISGEGCHGQLFRGDCSKDLVENKDQFLGGGGGALVGVKNKRTYYVIHFFPTI